jgi:predicted RNase H-like nuclease (RuvC/YqgF family)
MSNQPFISTMCDFEQIRANLVKIRELDQRLQQYEREEQTRKSELPLEVTEPGRIEFTLLLEEMEVQQEIGRKLRTENQQLLRKLETEKLKLGQTHDEISNFSNAQKAALDKQRREMESEQHIKDQNSRKEEARLKQTIDLIQQKNQNLIQERDQLRKKLSDVRASLGKKNRSRKPK